MLDREHPQSSSSFVARRPECCDVEWYASCYFEVWAKNMFIVVDDSLY